MKKTLFTLVAATAMILGLAGCDKITKDALDNDSESWGGQVSEETKDATEQYTATMTVSDDFEPDSSWDVWTDVKGLVLPKQPTKKVNADKSITWTFSKEILDLNDYNQSPSSEYFVLYIHIKGTDKKAGSLENKDVRGRVMIYNNRKVTFESKNYKEVIDQVGVVSIKNDEPTATGSVYKNGDYTITEIWPLDPLADKENDVTEEDGSVTYANAKIGGKYGLVDSMYFKDLKIKKGETVKFPVKAGSQIVGLYQPNREKATDGEELVYNGPSAEDIVTKKLYDLDGDKVNEATRVDLYGLDVSKLDYKKTEDAEKIKAAYAKANTATIFGELIEVKAHEEAATVDSSNFKTYYFKAKDKVRFKTAANDYVIDVNVVEAPIEK